MIFRIALRYSFSRMNRHLGRSVRIMLSLAFSTAVLIVVLSVMDYLQNTRLSRIRDIKSFDLVVKDASVEEVEKLYPGCTVFQYSEEMALVEGHVMNIRYMDPATYDGDLELLTGDFSCAVIPYSLFIENGLSDISMNVLHGSTLRDLKTLSYAVSGVYSTSLGSSFDPSYLFLPVSASSGQEMLVAVKGSDDGSALESRGYQYSTWKESESTLYSAFLLERFMMIFILSFLFLITFFQLRQEIRVFFSIKRNERVELMVLGMEEWRIYSSFTLSFVILVFSALLLGAGASLLILHLFSLRLSSMSYLPVELKFSIPSFVLICICMTGVSIISCFFRIMKERGKSPLEVLYGR